jgi:hypothetical protein
MKMYSSFKTKQFLSKPTIHRKCHYYQSPHISSIKIILIPWSGGGEEEEGGEERRRGGPIFKLLQFLTTALPRLRVV